MPDGIDIVQLVKALPQRRRGRALVVLTREYAGQAAWAAKLAEATGADHLDLLAHFASDAALAGSVAQYDVETLFKFLPKQSRARVLIVSGLEFLIATWAGQSDALERFATQVEMWPRSPCLVFVMQHDETITTWAFDRHPQYQFVIEQADTYQI